MFGNRTESDVPAWQKAEDFLATVEADAQNEDTSAPLSVDIDEETSKHVRVRIDKRVLDLIDAKDARRERLEEIRANHRNFNRMMTLVVAIVLGFLVTYFFQNDGFPLLGWHHALQPSQAKTLSGYSFVITVLLDAGLAAYALIRHY